MQTDDVGSGGLSYAYVEVLDVGNGVANCSSGCDWTNKGSYLSISCQNVPFYGQSWSYIMSRWSLWFLWIGHGIDDARQSLPESIEVVLLNTL